MSLSHGEMNQMEAAAINRQKDKEYLLLEQEIMGKWARGELVEVVRCKDCIRAIELNNGRLLCELNGGYTHKPGHYCADGERKEIE